VAVTVRRGLRPLVRLGDEVGAIDARSLSSRLPTEGQAREIVPLSAKLNELLARLEDSFERERRMTSNLAHELRTPIAEIRAATDVALKWPDDPVLQKDAIATAHGVAVRMGGAVDALLRLARAGARAAEPDWQDVDLSGVIDAALAARGPAASAAGLDVVAEALAPLRARTDAGLFALIAGNLVDNAVSHTPRGGRIESRLENGGAAAVWTLRNAPVDMSREDLGRVGEPLWTQASARSTREHAGLGLPLARAVADLLGIALEFGLDGRQFRATVRVPLRGA
jgi:two-component system sensor histidine kinase QseC